MRITKVGAALLSVQATVACYASAPFPSQPDLSRVSSVRVTALVQDFAVPHRGETLITDEPKVASIVNVIASKFYRWLASDVRRVPVYRVELLEGDMPRAIYYLGANSYPPRFPCYSLCTGWWLGTAREDGTFDSTRYVGLAETQSSYLLSDLDIP